MGGTGPPPLQVTNVAAYDKLLIEYVEYAWTAGHTRGDTGNALSGSLHVYPELRGKGNLSESWYMLNAWAWYEVPTRAPPLPPLVCLGLAWFCIRSQRLDAAFLLVAGFDSFLRTGEILSLTIGDISLDRRGSGVIKLAHTKTGQRHAAFEASTMLDPMVAKLFLCFQKQLPPGTHKGHYIYAGSMKSFYDLFEAGLAWLGVQSYGLKPYSIRRGGATSYYRRTRRMDDTLERGRWASYRVARIYVNDGLAKEVEMNFPPLTQARLETVANALALWLARQ